MHHAMSSDTVCCADSNAGQVAACLGSLKAEKGAGMVVHEELQCAWLQQVACMMQL